MDYKGYRNSLLDQIRGHNRRRYTDEKSKDLQAYTEKSTGKTSKEMKEVLDIYVRKGIIGKTGI